MALDFPNAPSPGQVFDSWEWDGSKWIPVAGPISLSGTSVPIVFFFPGLPVAGFNIVVPIAIPLIIPGNFAGSQSAISGSLPTASAAFPVSLFVPATGQTVIGTATVAPPMNVTWSTQAAVNLAVGDALIMTAPNPQDATLSDLAFTILATRA